MKEIIIKSILALIFGSILGILIYMLVVDFGQNIPADAIKI